MIPPTSIDGTDITGATIDGQDVEEITVDGDVVFSAGPTSYDISMLSSPVYHFDAQAVNATDGSTNADFPETEGNISDASNSNGVTFRQNEDGFASFEYDGSGQHHEWDTDSDAPTGNGAFTVLITLKPSSANSQATMFVYGNEAQDKTNGMGIVGGKWFHFFFANDLTFSSVVVNKWVTFAVRFNGSTREGFVNGVSQGSDTTTADVGGTLQPYIGGWSGFNTPFDGYIADIVLCDVAESTSAIQSYHTNRASIGTNF